MNGLASVAAAVACADLIAQLTGSPWGGLPWTERLILWTPTACVLIIALTLLNVIPISGLARDPRAWLMLTATALMLIPVAEPLLGLGPAVSTTALGMIALAGGAAAQLRPGTVPTRPVDATASTIGGFVVIAASLTILLTAAVNDLQGPAMWCSTLAGLISSVRLLRNVRDIAALSASRHEALTDELTGVPNRRALLRRADELLNGGTPLVLALIDLDHFKRINDELGHAAGDQMLRQAAHRLSSVLQPGELLGRLGGDEFALLATLPTNAHTDARMQQLGVDLTTVLTPPVDVSGFAIHISASIGLTTSRPGHSEGDVNELLRQADAAMYEAKASHGAAVTYDSNRHDSHGQLRLLEELRTALLERQLVLHYQPQVHVATGQLAGVEALVRWQHPTRGLLAPAHFVGLAETQGLMRHLTDQVLEQAVTQLATWHAAGTSVRMSVNLSGSNLLDTALPDRISHLLAHHHVPPDLLVLEVTETVLVNDSDTSNHVLQALSDLGVGLSIDDFGTGWSSLAYLRRLPVDELKLDASFTRDLLTDPKTAAIVASTITLALDLGLRVVAEGVEDQATLEHLTTLGCDHTQGYWHARPLPPDDLRSWATHRMLTSAPLPGPPAREELTSR